MELLIRVLIGGAIVSAFALAGDIFKPKSFAGLFAAAPSVALASLGLTILNDGAAYAAVEARSMAIAAVAFFFYARCCAYLMGTRHLTALSATLCSLPVWAAVSWALWALLLA
ncbi:MAG TPA: DUF3147 family protein [Steroidobacteraceae bacterium]|jgi:hypothetical protein